MIQVNVFVRATVRRKNAAHAEQDCASKWNPVACAEQMRHRVDEEEEVAGITGVGLESERAEAR